MNVPNYVERHRAIIVLAVRRNVLQGVPIKRHLHLLSVSPSVIALGSWSWSCRNGLSCMSTRLSLHASIAWWLTIIFLCFQCTISTPCSDKKSFVFRHNLSKCRLISTFSLFPIKLPMGNVTNFHLIFATLLHYLGKFEIQNIKFVQRLTLSFLFLLQMLINCI